MKTRKLQGCVIAFMLLGILISCASGNTPVKEAETVQKKGPAAPDYTTALKDAVYFYDANKCGKEVALDNVFDWRGPCHTTDGKDKGLDLSGGFHDAGDFVKFGLPQGYSAFVLGWSLYAYKDIFESAGIKKKLLSTLKYFTDYFIKCHPDKNTFYYQIGDGNYDHTVWSAPEAQDYQRPALFAADPKHPASDVCGVTAAACALMYLNYKDIDKKYAAKCLKLAKELYAMGKKSRGVSSGQSFYVPHNYYDDLALAAVWLYAIEKKKEYLNEVNKFLSIPTTFKTDPYKNKWTLCWDDTYQAVFIKMAELTGEQKFKDAAMFDFNFWINTLAATPGGLKYLNEWGVLRYAAAQSMCALIYYKQTKDPALKEFARSQIDYILGMNPLNLSYVIGFGPKYPINPHHRAANVNKSDTEKGAKYLLLGALVGGPNRIDEFTDNVNMYQATEVAIDYNAGLVGALAGMIAEGTN